MSLISEKIREARKARNLTQLDLAEKTGINRVNISDYENDKMKIGIENLEKIAKALGKPLSYFIEEEKNIPDTSIPLRKIPVISQINAGAFLPVEDPFPQGFADEWVYTTEKGEHMYALRVVGDSMEDEFFQGEIVSLNPDLEARNNDYVAVKCVDDDEVTLKQYKRYGKTVVLHPVNSKYDDIVLNGDKEYLIVGVVVEKVKKYR